MYTQHGQSNLNERFKTQAKDYHSIKGPIWKRFSKMHTDSQILADQLTLYQPGRQIMPTTFLLAPHILGPPWLCYEYNTRISLQL